MELRSDFEGPISPDIYRSRINSQHNRARGSSGISRVEDPIPNSIKPKPDPIILANIPRYLRRITDGYYKKTSLKELFLSSLKKGRSKKTLRGLGKTQPIKSGNSPLNKIDKCTFSRNNRGIEIDRIKVKRAEPKAQENTAVELKEKKSKPDIKENIDEKTVSKPNSLDSLYQAPTVGKIEFLEAIKNGDSVKEINFRLKPSLRKAFSDHQEPLLQENNLEEQAQSQYRLI